MHPAKIQISLGIRPVWSVFAVCMKKHWALNYLLSAQWKYWSDWADAQADSSLHWVHIIFLVLSCGSLYSIDFDYEGGIGGRENIKEDTNMET